MKTDPSATSEPTPASAGKPSAEGTKAVREVTAEHALLMIAGAHAVADAYRRAAQDALGAFRDLQADRDEWRRQHDYLLDVRRADIAALNARLLAAQERIAALESANAAMAKDAGRYRFVRDQIDWLTSDEAGMPGIAFSCQIQLSVIDKSSGAELLDMIADAHLYDAAITATAADKEPKT